MLMLEVKGVAGMELRWKAVGTDRHEVDSTEVVAALAGHWPWL